MKPNSILVQMVANVITSIRRKDPKIYDSNAQWFDGGEEEETPEV
jgi:hypothetical protein